MVLAVAALLRVEESSVVLSFQVSSGRRQAAGVIVSVGLRNFSGSTKDFATRITQESIDLNMGKVGLKPVQLVSAQATTFPGAYVKENGVVLSLMQHETPLGLGCCGVKCCFMS
jgi:hypothetical protein